MFSDINKNQTMVLGAYKKIKSYYHYNKNFLFMRKKIAEYEFDAEEMDSKNSLLARVLKSPEEYTDLISEWINEIDYYVLPKSFASEKKDEDRFVSNTMKINKAVNKVNFFIDMPFELHILETVWTMFIGKLAFDNSIIEDNCYGNVLDNNMLYCQSKSMEDSINYNKNKLFKIYYGQYCAWKNDAIDCIDKNKENLNMVMISLDIQSFYYSVKWRFEILNEYINKEEIRELIPLTSVIEMIYKKYTSIIAEIRVLNQSISNREYILPIGMFSSMVLANIYLSRFDKSVKKDQHVLYYGRYVDDMLFVMNLSDIKFDCNYDSLNEVISIRSNLVEITSRDSYCLHDYPELTIQKEKFKVVYFEAGQSTAIINKLKNTKLSPSQMNIFPNDELDLNDFEEAAYAIENFNTETKIRDIGRMDVNRFKLGRHMAQLVMHGKCSYIQLSSKDKADRDAETNKILSFFRDSNSIEYNSNWINALYFFVLIEKDNKSTWKTFENNIRAGIGNLRMKQVEGIKGNRVSAIKATMKKQLNEQFDICIATAGALKPNFLHEESDEIKSLTYKIRNANLFNHYLISFPLVNYLDDLDKNIDLTSISFDYLKQFSFGIKNSRKLLLTPRFITLEELFQYAFLESAIRDNKWHIKDDRIDFISNLFYSINVLDTKYAKPFQINIESKEVYNNYYMQDIKIKGRKIAGNNVKVALANIKMDVEDCCLGLGRGEVQRNRTDFVSFLKSAYKSTLQKVDFLLFPEFYLPLQWVSDVMTYVKKTEITIITGLQYITKNEKAHNTVGIFAPIYSGKYKNSCMIIREKNDYAPFEKELLAIKGYRCDDHKIPVYTRVDCGGVRIGTFLCYELTDIVARSLYKDKVDIIFAPENNKDTSYFSNIIETTARDLHTFIVQANTSVYGDSRITGPYGRDHRNVVRIKGGDNANLIIGNIDIDGVIKDREQQRNKLAGNIERYLEMSENEKQEVERKKLEKSKIEISKISARTNY